MSKRIELSFSINKTVFKILQEIRVFNPCIHNRIANDILHIYFNVDVIMGYLKTKQRKKKSKNFI